MRIACRAVSHLQNENSCQFYHVFIFNDTVNCIDTLVFDTELCICTFATNYTGSIPTSQMGNNLAKQTMENNKNNEAQNRREFFKEAAKKALPILGIAVMSITVPSLIQSCQKENICTDCSGGCKTGCSGSCKNTCSGQCYRTCGATCYRTSK